ncbi:VWA domain-containing protein [Candidatus Thorarchaeota archaeon]|nr:MAG: VWA domain-containing protein [Candidatus Thorarchaeota archaeon]
MTIRTETSPNAEQLNSVARRAWDMALGDFFHPPLPDPVIEFSADAANFFYIDSSTWTVHLNTAGVPLHIGDSQHQPFLRSVCHHEIQHYLLCPFDGITSGMMFNAARKHLNDDLAMFVTNLYADLVVESSLLTRYPSLTHSRILSSVHESSLRTSNHSELWKLIVACYRAMWGFPIPSTCEVSDELYEIAKEVVSIARKSINRESRWPKACEKIAEMLADWLPEESFEEGDAESKHVPCGMISEEGSGGYLPIDVDAIMGSPLETRDGDIAKKCMGGGASEDVEAEMARLAKKVDERGGDLRDLDAVYILAGVGSPQAEWIRFWYRAKASSLIRFDVRVPESSGSVPLNPALWRLGDPIEDLDIVQSLQAFPVLVPNMSTRRWERMLQDGPTVSESMPDMLVVIDSSGSMTWRMTSKRVSGPYHTALVSAFAAINYALSHGSRIAVINFSDGVKTSDWSSDRGDVEHALLAYQGGGTVAPVKTIEEMCKSSEAKVLALIITDAEISNWKPLMRSASSLSRIGHRLVFFHIGGGSARDKKTHDAMRAAGAAVHAVKSVRDLPGIVVREVRSTYHS